MLRITLTCIALLLAAGVAFGEEPAAKAEKPAAKGDKLAAAPSGPKQMTGMSILGNDDAPKSLVIVPWKSSELGDPLAVSRALDDGRQPVDKDVFMRELDYYQIRASSAGVQGSGTR